MNKKGASLFSLVLIAMALAIASAVSLGNITPEQVDLVKENITTPYINFSSIEIAPELRNSLSYYANGIVSAYMELAKWVMSYAAENPDAPYELLLWLFILAIFAPLILVIFKMLIIIFLIIKEAFQSRKEKKRLKMIRRDKVNE